ncbi:MAG: excinuclease ABC subunit UvrC [Elusimicrobia bacterium]|nr:excinuclease ABC subunit UvrC [Elusimicrobiota bacterium]
MKDAGGKIIYIGKANNIKKRIASYFRHDIESKTVAIINSLRHIDYILASSEREALILERQLIREFQPYFNSMWRDDKSYPYLKLTKKEDFPQVILSRKVIKDGSEYFGPYPHVLQIKVLLKWLQKIFKFRPCKLEFSSTSLPKEEKVKSCLYYQTEKCPAPCLKKISSKDYKEKIKGISLFLKGKFSRLEKNWEKEMGEASRNLEYEKAAELRDRITAIKTLGERVTLREIKPEDLPDSLKFTEKLKELKNVLDLSRWPIVIEGFDISNISGAESVGSMVRFQNGQPDKNEYRKYKIKTVSGINDFAMLKEVVLRRYRYFKSQNKQFPDLILVDGGKGQLSMAQEVLKDLKLKIPAVSLAKKEEEIFVPGKKNPIRLPSDSQALQLLQSIRDEAHRFALSYHHLRRKKSLGI